MKNHKYHETWIREHFDEFRTISEMHKVYCELFDADISFRAMCHWCERRNLKSHRHTEWTVTEVNYLKEIYPLYGTKKVCEMINKKFGTNRTRSAVSSLASDLDLRKNPGVKEQVLRDKFRYENGALGTYNGYTYIRTDGGWYPYQRYIMEKEFGTLPDGYQVVFLDGDKTNFDISNLIAIPVSWMSTINKFGWSGELLEIGLMWFRLNELCNGKGRRVYRV